MHKGRFLLSTITFVLLVWILGLNVVAAQGPIDPETGSTSKPIDVAPPSAAYLVTDPALMPPGPPPAKRPEGTSSVSPYEGLLTENIKPNVSGRLIQEANGHIFWDTSNGWLHAHAWTVATTNYRNVEHWIWW